MIVAENMTVNLKWLIYINRGLRYISCVPVMATASITCTLIKQFLMYFFGNYCGMQST